MKHGIIIVSLGYQLYGSCAYNLALTIKAYDPLVSISLIHDHSSIAHLNVQERAFFDTLILADEKDYTVNGEKQYQRMKVCVDKYSPYDLTLYMDADNAWLPGKKVSWFFGELLSREMLFGQNCYYDLERKKSTNPLYTYWQKNGQTPQHIITYHDIKNNLPQTISGIFAFKKGEYSSKVFEEARRVYDDPNAPCMRWANGKPDEYCFNVALAKIGYQQEDKHIVYFKNVNGIQKEEVIYQNYWGIAIGGAEVDKQTASLYNRIVNSCSVRMKMETRHYHQDKKDHIKERAKL